MRSLMKILGLVFTFLMLGGVAFGQGSIASTGGLGGDIEPVGTSNVHLLHDRAPETTFPLVDGQNPEGAPAQQNYLSWDLAVQAGREGYRAQHTPESLGDAARRYRASKPAHEERPIPMVLPRSLPAYRRDPFTPERSLLTQPQ